MIMILILVAGFIAGPCLMTLGDKKQWMWLIAVGGYVTAFALIAFVWLVFWEMATEDANRALTGIVE